MSEERLRVMQLQWGWITPGTSQWNEQKQRDDHLAMLARPVLPRTKHFLFTHCGWWLDVHASEAVRRLTRENPEPLRAIEPTDRATADALRRYVEAGRVEYILYPYAACVSEATTGESLLRGFRMGMAAVRDALGVTPRALLSHDYCYGLDWAAAQMPRIARLVGVESIMSELDGMLRGPDGTTIRTFAAKGHEGLLDKDRPIPEQPIFIPLEMHVNLDLHRDLSAGTSPRRHDDFDAITIDQYLAAVDGSTPLDSRAMGTKGWYGGEIDLLMMEQDLKTVELRLPALEALAVLSGRTMPDREDWWKRLFVLLDNHFFWMCHEYKSHWRVESRRLLDETMQLEQTLLAGDATETAIFNPTPWPHDLVVTNDDETLHARNVPGWGISRASRASPKHDDDTTTLARSDAAYALGPTGEILAATIGGRRWQFEGVGQLLRIMEEPDGRTLAIPPGKIFRDYEGSFSATATLQIPDGASAVELRVPDMLGAAFAAKIERLDAVGNILTCAYQPLHNLHWGGTSMPRRNAPIGPVTLASEGAKHLRVTLWMIAEGTIRLGKPNVPMIGDWSVNLIKRVKYLHLSNVEARVIRSDSVAKTIRFTGQFPDLRCEMDVTLTAAEPTLAYDLRLHFDRPTDLGLTTPPFTSEDGSMLGCGCERPYVPGLMVTAPLPALPGACEYFVDKPFLIQPAFHQSEHTWHTDKQDWWLGMSPFIGMNLAAAQWQGGQLGLFTRGIKHFCRWRHSGRESLGLSLGATIVHPMLIGQTVKDSCVLAHAVKRRNFDPYEDKRFLAAAGTYRFHYGYCLAGEGEAERCGLWRLAQQFALPGQRLLSREAAGVRVDPPEVVLTALEPCGGQILLRAFNLSANLVEARIALPFDFEVIGHDATREGRTLCAAMGSHAILEAPLRRT